MNKPNRIEKILMERDGLTYEEAHDTYKEVFNNIMMMIEDGDLFEMEEYFMGELGLEPDYLEDILFSI
jgi:hypothetical protein